MKKANKISPDFVTFIESKIGTTTERQGWTATLLKITERQEKSIKILVKFETDNFSFEEELKVYEEHFTEGVRYNDEIIRRLKRLKDYTAAITLFQEAEAPTITTKWKGFVSNVEVISPVEAKLTVMFAVIDSGELLELVHTINTSADIFVSRQQILNLIEYQIEIFNRPIDINYYRSLIQIYG